MTLSYELCKKLKDTGFPQHAPPYAKKVTEEAGIEYLHRPTLSELIDACEEEMSKFSDFTLTKSFVEGDGGSGWVYTARIGAFEATGNSYEKAVANLWLDVHNHSGQGE